MLDASARTVSLAENLLRETMHPADHFDALAALRKESNSVEDIAADFGVTPLVVSTVCCKPVSRGLAEIRVTFRETSVKARMWLVDGNQDL